jgi:hypothetical protein
MKLVVLFVSDLSKLLQNLQKVLSSGGTIIISIPKTELIEDKFCLVDTNNHNEEVTCNEVIGDTELKIHLIWCSQKILLKIFAENGFEFVKEDISIISKDIAESHNFDKEKAVITKRLNIRFDMLAK